MLSTPTRNRDREQKEFFFGIEREETREIEELRESLFRISLKLAETKDMFNTIGASINKIGKYVEANEKNMTGRDYARKEESKNGFLVDSVLFPCKYSFNGPVYVLLTTTPARINGLEKYLDLLHKQTYGIKEIILSIPYIFERTGEEYPPIPEYLQDRIRFPLLRILRGKDYGPATKFLLPIESFSFPDDAGLVVLDDDTRYSRHLVCDYLYVHEKFPEAALGRRGQAYNDNCDPTYRVDRVQRLSHDQRVANFVIRSVDLLSGVGTYFIQKRFINRDILTIKSKCPKNTIDHMFFTDDIFISGYLAYKNITRIVFSDELSREELNRPYMLGSGPGALWDINRQTSHNDNATAALGLYWGCRNKKAITSRYEDILCRWNNEE
ncbi:putative integral membrane protein [Cryptosporidium felis]|nr:putative integral membrane protein [Cryptosporidium felis]